MVSENRTVCAPSPVDKVLILVLVEDGLGVKGRRLTWLGAGFVLILVLVEDGLGVKALIRQRVCDSGVLILVLVEDGLGAAQEL